MKTLTKGICKNGRIELLEDISLEDGKEALVVLSTEHNGQVDLNYLLAQQETLKKIWGEEEEYLYRDVVGNGF